MHIEFECSGGYGGLRFAYQGEIDALPDAEAKVLRGLIEAADIFNLTPEQLSNKARPIPDDFACRLTLLKAGKKKTALGRIHRYYREQESINAAVGSAEVTQNLDRDLKELRQRVEDTFEGSPSAVSRKQKSNSKTLQYEGYKGRR